MKLRLNPWLTTTYLLSALVSLVIISSISPDRFLAQVAWLSLGFGLYLYFSQQDPALYTALAKAAYPTALLLLVATLVLGEHVRGSVRWIPLFGFNLQTSELVKPLLILSFARYFSTHPPRSLRSVFLSLLLLSAPLALILRQPDLGTALVICTIFATQIFVAGLSPWLIAAALALLTYLGSLAPHFLHDYQLARLESFLNPGKDPLGIGYNVIQSQIAIGSGGLFGKGLGHGTQSHLRFLPERHTDFVFASLVEELGLLGGSFVLIVLFFLLIHLTKSMLESSTIPRLVLAGAIGYLLFQTFINIGMNLGVAPVTGVTLPLISYGGSSILALSITFGIVGAYLNYRRFSHDLIEIR